MRVVLTSIVIATLVTIPTARPQGGSADTPSRVPPGPVPATPVSGVAGLLRYEPTGLSLLGPRSGVRRVVFIATPHRGSRIDRGRLERLGARLVRIQEPLRAAYGRLMGRNGPGFFKERLREGLPTSIDELEWGSPILAGL